MIDFQAAERQRLEEPASDIGLEPLCAMVCDSLTFLSSIQIIWWTYRWVFCWCYLISDQQQSSLLWSCNRTQQQHHRSSSTELCWTGYALKLYFLLMFHVFIFRMWMLFQDVFSHSFNFSWSCPKIILFNDLKKNNKKNIFLVEGVLNDICIFRVSCFIFCAVLCNFLSNL